MLFLGIFHCTFDVYAHHGICGIRAYGYRLAERTDEFAFAIICNRELAGFSGHDGCFCVFGHSAAARRESLLNDQRFVTGVGEREYAGLRIFLLKCAEVVRGLVEFDDGLCQSRAAHAESQQGDEKSENAFHIILY